MQVHFDKNKWGCVFDRLKSLGVPLNLCYDGLKVLANARENFCTDNIEPSLCILLTGKCIR